MSIGDFNGVDKMVEVGIPVYKAREVLPMALDSLVCQTQKNFLVCLSIDGDGEDYTDIINTYSARGLKIRVINGQTNGGAGVARQRIIDSTMCDYIMFLDADDLFFPRTIELLYKNIRLKDYDVVRGSFIREQNNKEDILMAATDNVITWCHSKIYKVNFLKEKKISFPPYLRTDEDAYFNAVVWNSTKNKGIIQEILYLWRDNKNSITRALPRKEYFSKNYLNYIRSQVEALKKIFEINDSVESLLVTHTLINIYYYYMQAKFYKLDESAMIESIGSLKDKQWFKVWVSTGENWMDIIKNVKPGQIYENTYVVFFEESFNKWLNRICNLGSK